MNDLQALEMYHLYARYYGGTSQQLFLKDLSQKSHVILLIDGEKAIRGFSTVRKIETEFEGRPVRALFSGDTIVEDQFWGKNDLAQSWLKYAGKVKREHPQQPLYWFLIVKGQRTYRYLNVFSRTYFPALGVETPVREKKLMDQLSLEMFGEAYDQKNGVLRFHQSQGHLREEWADIPKKDLRRPEVQFFLERNSGYRLGHELVCLCELSEENLKPLSRRIFSDPD